MNYPDLKFFQFAPTYREEARALLALMDRYDWSTFSLIIDPNLPGEEELISEIEQISNNQQNWYVVLFQIVGIRYTPLHMHTTYYFNKNFSRIASCNRVLRKGQKGFSVLSVISIVNTNQTHIKRQLTAKLNPETRVIVIHTTSTVAALILKVAKELSLTGEEYMWIMTSIVLSTYTSEDNHKLSPYESPNTRRMEFIPGMLALYNGMTRDAVLARFDRHVAPLIVNVFSKLTNHPIIQQWKNNESARYESDSLLIDEFKRSSSIFQKDGLSLAGNYSLYNFQMPKKEWKRVGEYINGSLSMADLQWPGNRSKPPPGKPIIYYLKAVTLEEPPFVMMKDPSIDGKCMPGSVICRVGPESV
ncbi:unnamed protein product [Didymodactylos carnosus]|uniref:Receptor ligand binding region domain-containing protein n=1 Tax=Didymodactylos carnosus TaxID=1234261 RepID=A0A815PBY9_9BILA|nr:unnamed protein product [Didymodactylos carnosus]CAF1447112.1 unnamed protein product [Didymodactylos carnosus]CAF4069286.1 unnamed protein product [Didymodactylos carnosus]CAF4321657.1 unnamed protein product [Didymodactylos carnosus]